jgi:hypothetical protein
MEDSQQPNERNQPERNQPPTYTPEQEAADRERVRRKRAREKMQRQLKYNRDRAIALFTGAACVLVSLGSTILAGYNAINMTGILAGLLLLASFAVADLAVYCGAHIDYHEDGTALEWVAMGVKYGLSIILLCCGGLVAYKMLNGGEGAATDDAITERATAAFNKCMARPGAKEASCQKIYDKTVQNGTGAATARNSETKKDTKWADKTLAHPLFTYAPGILGLLAFALIAVTAKLSKPKEVHEIEEDEVDYQPRRQPIGYTQPQAANARGNS